MADVQSGGLLTLHVAILDAQQDACPSVNEALLEVASVTDGQHVSYTRSRVSPKSDS